LEVCVDAVAFKVCVDAVAFKVCVDAVAFKVCVDAVAFKVIDSGVLSSWKSRLWKQINVIAHVTLQNKVILTAVGFHSPC